jgi:hypothetical protein
MVVMLAHIMAIGICDPDAAMSILVRLAFTTVA